MRRGTDSNYNYNGNGNGNDLNLSPRISRISSAWRPEFLHLTDLVEDPWLLLSEMESAGAVINDILDAFIF